MAAARGIRPYGPGKFSTIVDSYASGITLDGGADEEVHVADSYYGLVRIDHEFRDLVHEAAADEGDRLTGAEEELLDRSMAVIFHERSDGIVEADWFEDLDEAEDAWAELEEEFESESEEDER
jgi:hypothetical protein